MPFFTSRVKLLGMLLCLSFMLSACGTRIDAIADTVKYAISGPEDITLTAEQIDSFVLPVSYLRWGNNPRVAVVLKEPDSVIASWFTGKNQVVSTYHGRVIRTFGLSSNINWLSDSSSDPLACIGREAIQCSFAWNYKVLVGHGLNAKQVSVSSRFEKQESSSLKFSNGEIRDVTLWSESLQAEIDGELNGWQNRFWIDDKTSRVVKSEQSPLPNYDSFYIELINPETL